MCRRGRKAPILDFFLQEPKGIQGDESRVTSFSTPEYMHDDAFVQEAVHGGR